jgi:DNA polymerase delta subunit 1
LKIFCFNPTNVPTIRNWLKPGNRSIGGADIPPLTFESNMPYALRFMIDKNIVGMGWVKLIGGHYSTNLDPKTMQSKC